MSELEHLRADNQVLKDLADGLASELVRVRASRACVQKEALEQGLIINSNNKVMRDLREANEIITELNNGQKDQIIQFAASLTAAQIEAKSKGKYIDEHMAPLKNKAQEEQHGRCRAEAILTRFGDQMEMAGKIIWARGEVMDLMAAVIKEVDDEAETL